MKKTIPIFLFILLFLSGLGVLLYPTVSQIINARSQTKAVQNYQTQMQQMPQEDYSHLLYQATEYNQALFEGKIAYASAYGEKRYKSLLAVEGSTAIGFIKIPKLELALPIYHGTSHEVLQVGIGHIQGTSLPVGGENTHAVLSGHRGLPSAKLFTNMDKIAVGDTFSLHVLSSVLTYEVDQIEVVLPHEVDSIRIIEGGDYATLVTCTPYGINSHRLLVRGHRVETSAQTPSPLPDVPQELSLVWDISDYLVISLFILIVICALTLSHRRFHRRVIAHCTEKETKT